MDTVYFALIAHSVIAFVAIPSGWGLEHARADNFEATNPAPVTLSAQDFLGHKRLREPVDAGESGEEGLAALGWKKGGRADWPASSV